MQRLLLVLVLLGWYAGCAKPKPPTITPQSVKVTSLSPTALGLRAQLDVHNPNAFPLVVRSVSGKLVFDGNIEGGSAETTSGVSVAANATQRVSADLNIPWTNLAQLAPLAMSGKVISYRFNGKATIGGKSLNVNLPFSLTGSLTSAELVQVGLGSLPKLPGLAQ